MKFKIGDRVKIVNIRNVGGLGDFCAKLVGSKGVIESIGMFNDLGIRVEGLENKGGVCGLFWFHDFNLELIKEPKYKDGIHNWFGENSIKFAKENKSITFTPKYQIGDIVKCIDGKEHEITAIKYIKSKTVFNHIYYYLSDSGDVSVIEAGLELVRRKGEKKKGILDKTEKRYLSNIIRPFRDKVKYIVKNSSCIDESCNFIKISFERSMDGVTLPYFKKNTMYKGMELDKNYTLKELGL